MKNYLLIIILIITSSLSAMAIEEDNASNDIDIYLPAKIKLGKGLENYNPGKAETGMQLAMSLSREALLYPGEMMDSVLSHYENVSDKPNAFQIAKEVGAHHVLFANLARVEQLLRVNLVSIDLDSLQAGYTLNDALKTAHKGEGFAYINYWQQDGKPMLDPAIVTATQRAMAKLKNDSLLYDDAQEPYKVYPHPSLVMGGVLVKDTTGFPIKSEIFGNRMVSSFATSEAVFETMSKQAPFVTWDIATKDTLLTVEGIYGVENLKLATQQEMSSLWKAGAEYIVMGTLTRIPKGGRLDLYLGRIGKNGTYEKVAEYSSIMKGDTIELLINHTKETAAALIKEYNNNISEEE